MSSSGGKKPVPVYLRGIPAELVREAKAMAARRGITLAGFVAHALARAIQEPEPADEAAPQRRTLTPVPPAPESGADEGDLSREVRWYERTREHLARQYAGEFVAIIDNRVVDHDPHFDALAERMFAQYGTRSIFMPEVQAHSSDPKLRLRSPRIARRA